MSRNILGLDVGSHSVKAVELARTLRDVKVVQLREHRWEPGAHPREEQLREFLGTHDLPTGHVVCALAGDRISNRTIRFPFGDRRKIAQAVPFEVENQVPFDLEDIVIDSAPLSRSREGAELVASVAPRKEIALLLNTTLREAGIDPRVVEGEGLVLGNLSGLFDLSGRLLLVDLGHRKTTVCLIVDGQAVTARSFPVGGAMITEAIAKDLECSLEHAERVKHEDGLFDADLDSRAEHALRVVNRLAREIVRTLGSLEPQLGGPAGEHLDRIVLCGGGARLHRLDEFLAGRTGIHTERLELPRGPEASALVAGGDPLSFATAIALAVRGSGRATTRMNFRQHELAYRVDLNRMLHELRWTGVLVVLALLLLGVRYVGAQSSENRGAEAIESQIEALYREALPGRPVPADPVVGLRTALQDAEDRADVLGIRRGNLSALDILAEISARVPERIEVVFEELGIDGKLVRIRGHTTSFEAVDQLQAELGRFSYFTRIQTSELEASDRGGINFNMSIGLEQGGSR